MEQFKSTKIMPYVYICTHRLTQKFYIGYREKNVNLGLTSDQDLPMYQTSSKNVNPIFNEFEWKILAEFETGDDAYDFEQFLIFENWGDPLLLNEHCHYESKNRFKNTAGHKLSKSTRQKMSASKKGKKIGDKNPMFGKTGEDSPNFGKVHSEETRKKMSEKATGRPGRAGDKNPMFGKKGPLNPMYGIPRSVETKQKISEHNKGQIGLSGDKNPRYGKKWSEEHKQMLREKSAAWAAAQGADHIGTNKLRESVEKMMLNGTHPTMRETVCEHCSRAIKGMSNYARWHGNNCKNKD